MSFVFYIAVEGWVIFVSNLNEEVSEEDVQDKFADFGKVKDVRLNLDHRSGYVKVKLSFSFNLIVFYYCVCLCVCRVTLW